MPRIIGRRWPRVDPDSKLQDRRQLKDSTGRLSKLQSIPDRLDNIRKDRTLRRNWLRFSWNALAPSTLLASFFLGAAGSSQAQAPLPAGESPARFVPNENLAAFAEFDGLDAHSEAWRKTIAYRLLNETTTGSMLEDLFSQVYSRYGLKDLPAPEALLLLKHCAKSGFVVGTNVWKPEGSPQKGVTVFVIRDAFSNKEVRPIFARLLVGLPAKGTKAQTITKAGHKWVTGKRTGGEVYAWWVEETKKKDLIVATGSEGMEELVLQTLDAKKPSALANSYRGELAKPKEGFERTGFFLLDSTVFRELDPTVGLPLLFERMKISKLDFSGGFQGDALATVSRVHPKALEADGGKSAASSFEKASIPGIPSGVLAFTVLALDLKAMPAQVHKIKALGDQYDAMAATLKQKTKLRFEEDVLGQLGPKIAAYVVPSKTASPPASVLPNALSLLTKVGASGADAIPRVALLIDVVNPSAFGKTLDEIMAYVNRQVRASYAAKGGPANESGPDRGGRGRGPSGPPSPEFRLMSGEVKSYVFIVPPELSGTIPASFRPTIRVGPKQVAIALSAEAARQALEAKAPYAPPSEIASAFGRLPSKLNWLLVADPRDSTPEILASLPAKLQAGINTMIPPSEAPPAGGASPSAAPAPGASRSGRKTLMTPEMTTPSPAPEAAAPTPKSGSLVLQVDPSKLPSADDTRKLLFPSIYTVDHDGDILRFSTREAFPPIPDPSILGVIVRSYRARVNQVGAATAPRREEQGPGGKLPAARPGSNPVEP